MAKEQFFDLESDRDQLDRFRLLVESIQDYAIFLLDTEGRIASWNPGAQKFKGYKPLEIIGKHFSVFYTEADKRAKKPQNELEISKIQGRVEDEGWRVRKDGSRFWANVIITALYDQQGKHLGYAKVTRDLTERKEYEDTLYETNLKLEASYSELQELSNVKDEFVSLASHQLRTPATGVKQYIALLLDGYVGELTERQRDYLQKAFDSNNRQIEIINDLLKVAQVDAGKVVLKKSDTDIQELITSIVDEQIDLFKNKKQKLTLQMPEKPVRIWVDKNRFRMVLENIIDNASKYTADKGEITISIAKDKNAIRITISDTGVGISKKDLSKLFSKFTRLSNPKTKHVSGSGLGLYWAYKIIKLHEGNIEVESVLRKGSAFTIVLPPKAKNA